MSIITDALRKAEDEKELKAKRVATIETPQPEVREEKVSPAQTLTESIFSQQVMQEQLADSVEFEEKSNWSRPFRILAVGFVVLSVCIWLVLPKKAAALSRRFLFPSPLPPFFRIQGLLQVRA